MKPATGFDAFASQTTSSPFAAAAANANKPAGGFGAFAGLSSSFLFGVVASASSAGNANAGTTQNKPAPGFGSSSGFGTKPVFRQSTVGQPSFGRAQPADPQEHMRHLQQAVLVDLHPQ